MFPPSGIKSISIGQNAATANFAFVGASAVSKGMLRPAGPRGSGAEGALGRGTLVQAKGWSEGAGAAGGPPLGRTRARGRRGSGLWYLPLCFFSNRPLGRVGPSNKAYCKGRFYTGGDWSRPQSGRLQSLAIRHRITHKQRAAQDPAPPGGSTDGIRRIATNDHARRAGGYAPMPGQTIRFFPLRS